MEVRWTVRLTPSPRPIRSFLTFPKICVDIIRAQVLLNRVEKTFKLYKTTMHVGVLPRLRHVSLRLSNLLGGVGIHRPWRRRSFVPSFLNDPNSVDVILLPDQLFGRDHQFVQTIDDAAGRTDSDAEVPSKTCQDPDASNREAFEQTHIY